MQGDLETSNLLGPQSLLFIGGGKCQGGQELLSGSCYFDLHYLSPSAGFFFRLGITLGYPLILPVSFERPKIQFYNLLVALNILRIIFLSR